MWIGACINISMAVYECCFDDVSVGAVVDRSFVRQSPNFGGAKRGPKNDPSVGFAYPTMKKDAKNSRSDGVKKTDFETKSRKGRGHDVVMTETICVAEQH